MSDSWRLELSLHSREESNHRSPIPYAVIPSERQGHYLANGGSAIYRDDSRPRLATDENPRSAKDARQRPINRNG